MCLTSLNNNFIYAGTLNAGVLYSTNNGDEWLPGGLTNIQVNALGNDGTNLFAGTYGSLLYKSTDYGNTWTQLNFGSGLNDNDLNVVYINFITTIGNKVFVGKSTSGANTPVLSSSTDGGASWINSSNGVSASTVTQITELGNKLYLAANTGLFVSTDSGLSWQYLNFYATSGVCAINNRLFANSGNMLFLSSNGGLNWVNINNGLPQYYDMNVLFPFGNNLIAFFLSKAYLTTNFGNNWSNIDGNFTGGYIALAQNSTYIFNAANDNYVYKRNISELIGIEKHGTKLPKNFSLSQNYPNPFNPSTKIQYDLPKSTFVKLTVYDVLGKEVKILVNEKQNSGSYNVEFDGSNLTSGVYFYKLTAGDFTAVRKFVLLK